MATPPTNLRLDITRRATRWSLLCAVLSSLVVVIALFNHSGRLSLTIYGLAFTIAWVSAAIQFRAYRAALADRPANEH